MTYKDLQRAAKERARQWRWFFVALTPILVKDEQTGKITWKWPARGRTYVKYPPCAKVRGSRHERIDRREARAIIREFPRGRDPIAA